jgi:methionyl-tRNA synthetase
VYASHIVIYYTRRNIFYFHLNFLRLNTRRSFNMEVSSKRVLVCSALPYCSNVLHLGNIIGSALSADVYARYQRAQGREVLLIGGCDCYGAPAMVAAMKEKTTPEELCIKYKSIHADICKWFGISFDIFGDTMASTHHATAQETMRRLKSSSLLVTKTTRQYYSASVEMFLPDRFVAGVCPKCNYEDARGDQCDGCGAVLDPLDLVNPRCTVDGSIPVLRETTHYYLDVASRSDEVRRWYLGGLPEIKWSAVASCIATDLIVNNPPEPGDLRCITRDLSWGVPVPSDLLTELKPEGPKTMYVWFEAVLSYLSMVRHALGEPGVQKWWRDAATRVVQFHAKDNVYFHSFLLPLITMAANPDVRCVDEIQATSYLQYEGQKFSKSRGVGVFGDQCAVTGIHADLYRWYLCAIRPEGDDSNFDWKDFQSKINGDLVNNLFNLVSRVTSFVYHKQGGVVRKPTESAAHTAFLAAFAVHEQSYHRAMASCMFRAAQAHLLRAAAECNAYMQDQKPWQDAQSVTAGTVMHGLVNAVYRLAVMLDPFMPRINDEIYRQLNVVRGRTETLRDEGDSSVRIEFSRYVSPVIHEGHRLVVEPRPIVVKITDDEVKRFREQFGGKK